MNVQIYSRKSIEELLKKNFPDNVAIISFYDPKSRFVDDDYKPVDYSLKTDRVFKVAIHDIDLEVLKKYNLTYNTYFPEVDEVAKFIYSAKEDGLDIICQCEYGESRSSACAAAILEHFYNKGLAIFVDYKYYPNQVVYHKVYDALEKYRKKRVKRGEKRMDKKTQYDELWMQESRAKYYLRSNYINVAEYLIRLAFYPGHIEATEWRKNAFLYLHNVHTLKINNAFPNEDFIFNNTWEVFEDSILYYGNSIIKYYGEPYPTAMSKNTLSAQMEKYFKWLASELSTKGHASAHAVNSTLKELGF